MESYVILLCVVIIAAGATFHKSWIPLPLILVITGMIISYFLNFPPIELKPELVLDIFLPMLLYQVSTVTSWKDIKKNKRPIALLSVGHVLFITALVAWVIHSLAPNIGWPLAFVLGAVISPPDDVAIVAIAEKIRMPSRLVTILEGEGMLNDVMALILFRFALAAAITHQFYVYQAIGSFFMIVIGETLYGYILANLLGKFRLRIHDPILHMFISVITPFLAYLPAERLGGCGVLATVVTGFIMGNKYLVKFTPEFRIVALSVWPALSFAIQSFLFLLIGLNLQSILTGISVIPMAKLAMYTSSVIAVVIVGRFIWVYASAYIVRFLFPFIRKTDPYPPWQYPFVVSWAGIRGSISLAAAFAVPTLPATIDGANASHLILFLVFAVIVATLVVQGLSLPWLLKVLNIQTFVKKEACNEHLAELSAREKMSNAVMQWLIQYKEVIKENPSLVDEVQLLIENYTMLNKQLAEHIENHNIDTKINESIILQDRIYLLSQIIEIEKEELLRLWRIEEINYVVRNKLLMQLDHRANYTIIV